MKKIIILALMMATTGVFSQVGIGTTSPHASAVLDLTATDKGFLLPRVANTAAIPAPTNGMIIYDLSANCTKVYANGAWSACLSSGTTPSVTANCNANGFVGSFVSGMALSGASFSVTLTNNSFSSASITFAAADLVLSGTTGLTVGTPTGSPALSAGVATINSGASVIVTYPITGTPGSTGTLTGTWTKVALNCVKTVAVAQPAIASLNCASATNSGTLNGGTAASGVYSAIAYTGGDGSAYSAQTVASTGVTGLTATLAAGNFATGAGNLTYTISGTPSAGGTASFAIAIGGRTCTLSRTVAPPITVPATLTLAQNTNYKIFSVYDQDYLPYTTPTGAATTSVQTADGTNETTAIDVQGTIPTIGITVKIPVTATGSGTLPAYSTSTSIPADMTEDGVSRTVTLSWAAQAYTTATQTITATLAAVGGTLNAKKLDINAGIGNDVLGVLMGSFTYPYDNAGATTTYSLRNIAGIPDKMFGVADNTGSTTSHNMLYLPVVAEDGKVWLNHNLGAHYADMNHASFNPGKQATSDTDYLAYGSSFQWGRKADGHELMTYTASATGTAVNGTTATLNNEPTDALFIIPSVSPYDWRVTQDDTLWATQASANNPCPTGFRVPTATEWTDLVTAAGITSSATAASATLKVTLPGYRHYYDGSLTSVGSYGFYWSSSASGTDVSYSYFFNEGADTDIGYPANGQSVRCIKD